MRLNIGKSLIKAQRPFRAICGSDDASTVFYHGVPFKFEKSLKEHTRFVNCVRYNTQGTHFATVSSDGRIFVYDGKTGDLIKQLGDPAHKGGIYACSWNKEAHGHAVLERRAYPESRYVGEPRGHDQRMS